MLTTGLPFFIYVFVILVLGGVYYKLMGGGGIAPYLLIAWISLLLGLGVYMCLSMRTK